MRRKKTKKKTRTRRVKKRNRFSYKKDTYDKLLYICVKKMYSMKMLFGDQKRFGES